MVECLENSKFYTPDISEFHVGFECESNYVLANSHEKDSSQFVPFVFTEDNFAYMIDAYTNDAYPSEFRVKSLDKEDIESLGFKCTVIDEYGSLYCEKDSYNSSKEILEYYTWSAGNDELGFSHYRMCHIFQTEGTPIKGPNGKYEGVSREYFKGDIKNKSELKVLLKQLGIDE